MSNFVKQQPETLQALKEVFKFTTGYREPERVNLKASKN